MLHVACSTLNTHRLGRLLPQRLHCVKRAVSRGQGSGRRVQVAKHSVERVRFGRRVGVARVFRDPFGPCAGLGRVVVLVKGVGICNGEEVAASLQLALRDCIPERVPFQRCSARHLRYPKVLQHAGHLVVARSALGGGGGMRVTCQH